MVKYIYLIAFTIIFCACGSNDGKEIDNEWEIAQLQSKAQDIFGTLPKDTTGGRLDEFLAGNILAISSDEVKGLKLFIATGCVSCHDKAMLGGDTYRKLGEKNPYETKDLGRYNETKKEQDKYFFKVPSLRNVAVTGPYLHDNSIKSLKKMVELMAWHQLGKKLTAEEIGHMVKFLDTLTDEKKEKK